MLLIGHLICLASLLMPITSIPLSIVTVSDIDTNLIDTEIKPLNISSDLHLMKSKEQKVEIKLYYECLCPDCRTFDGEQLAPTVLLLSQYLDLHLYPYGNAQTIIHDNGTYEFRCQHGAAECYGNKLHACTINLTTNITEAVIFNTCMMDYSQAEYGSDDAAADRCGVILNVDSDPIKKCAKSSKGDELLKYYGEESKKANFHYVPNILINGVLNDGQNFKSDVCKAFADPPPPCIQ